ncbi:MAG TPA: hypothetical protein VLV83_12450 [Acidobacteriota bacterium]|nr:hypothetical protein [Acidobacteriota bacterium]
MGKRWSTDIRHFLQGEAALGPESELHLRLYLTEIVKAATALNARQSRATALRCRRHRQRSRCPGRLEVRLQDLPAEIQWLCPSCGESGVILNWPRSPWDLSRKRRSSASAPVSVTLEDKCFRDLRSIDFIDPSSELLVYSARPEEGTVRLSGETAQFKGLIADLEAAAERERMETRRDRLGRLSEILRAHLDNLTANSSGLIRPGPLPRGLTAQASSNGGAVVEWAPLLAEEEEEEAWAGLSVQQLDRLQKNDWESPGAALRFHPHQLGLQAQHVPLMRNLLLFLQYFERSDSGRSTRGRSTRASNLNRKTVSDLLAALPLAEEVRPEAESGKRPWNEADFAPLHLLRLLAQKAGLISLAKGRFVLTAKGLEMLDPSASGDLYMLAFRTYYRQLDLDSLDRLPDCPEVAEGIGYALYSLGISARTWIETGELAHLLLLPEALARLSLHSRDLDYGPYLVEARILSPLQDFGLLERRDCPALSTSSASEVRLTELFDRLLEFNI